MLVNPLHAASPVPPMAPSPYLPVTRRFANPIYLRVEDVPEYAYLPEVGRARVDELAALMRTANTSADLLERDPVWASKRAALELVRLVPRLPGRQAAYDDVRRRARARGCRTSRCGARCPTSTASPRAGPRSSPTRTVPRPRPRASPSPGGVEFHCWLQWLLDEQLEAAQQQAVDAGMAIGVMHDLAVGVHPEGADAWALRDVLASGVAVGAPPDMYNQMGQDWSQPPWRPDALAEAAFIPYRDMLRTVLKHAGGIRIDHVLGLFRLWWIPRGMPANQGTYVRYDHDALVGILALEAQRAGCVVIGEDLGTVEAWVQDTLRDRGILGTSILWFEADDAGFPLPPEQWRELTLASVTTHDLPPTAGFLAGEHVTLRHELGLLTRPYDEELAAHEADLARWMDALRGQGLLRDGASTDDVIEALHRYLARTPARLLQVSLADAVGDRKAQNQPGTDQEYPNWRVPLTDADRQARAARRPADRSGCSAGSCRPCEGERPGATATGRARRIAAWPRTRASAPALTVVAGATALLLAAGDGSRLGGRPDARLGARHGDVDRSGRPRLRRHPDPGGGRHLAARAGPGLDPRWPRRARRTRGRRPARARLASPRPRRPRPLEADATTDRAGGTSASW